MKRQQKKRGQGTKGSRAWPKPRGNPHDKDAHRGAGKLLEGAGGKVTAIVKAEPVNRPAIPAAGKLNLAEAIGYSTDDAARRLVDIDDEERFFGELRNLDDVVTNIATVAAVQRGRMYFVAHQKFPAGFRAYCEDRELPTSTAYRYLLIGRNAHHLLAHPKLQEMGATKLELILSVPDAELHELMAKEGAADTFLGMSRKELAGIVHKYKRSAKQIEALQDQIDRGQDQLQQKDAEIRALRAGQDADAADDDAYFKACDDVWTAFKNAVERLRQIPPRNVKQLQTVLTCCSRAVWNHHAVIYDKAWLERLSPELRKAARNFKNDDAAIDAEDQ